jgi:hypothetical protein
MDAKAAFKQRVRTWSEKIGVEVVWLGIRPMRRKWASCSTNGHLNFNSELLQKDQKFQDYVIVHELWKSLMRGYLGDWEAVREELDQCKATNLMLEPV